MPLTMQDREHAFEAKFAHDEAFRFLVSARRDKIFARWAATKLGLTETAAAELVKSVLAIPDRLDHDHAVLARIAALLADEGYPATIAELATVLGDAAREARRQLLEAPIAHPGMA